jgi:PIN domain nuclease of toxin-antitoxin system
MRSGMPIYKHLKKHKLLLDTHVWVWLMTADEKLSTSFKNIIERNSEKESILISAITIWELGMLVEKKRIELEMDCLDWVEQALESPGIDLVPITPRIAIQSTRLPENVHGDPADKILIATAHEYNAVFVTHDQKILEYGKGKFINVYDPCK